MFNKYLLLTFLAGSLLITSCKDDPEPPNEEEIITTVMYTLTPDGGGTSVTMSFEDLDGDGGNAATIVGRGHYRRN